MTEEIMKMSSRELRRYQRAVDTVCKVHGLTPREIDMFFALVKNAEKMVSTMNAITETQLSIERSLNLETSDRTNDLATDLKKACFGGNA